MDPITRLQEMAECPKLGPAILDLLLNPGPSESDYTENETQSPCYSANQRNYRKRKHSCRVISNTLKGQAELKQLLERPRRNSNRKKLKPCDPSFIDGFKIAHTSQAQKKRTSSPARPLFRPEPEMEDEYYKDSDGLWIKNEVTPGPEDPYPIKHKELYPSLFPQAKYAETTYIPTKGQFKSL